MHTERQRQEPVPDVTVPNCPEQLDVANAAFVIPLAGYGHGGGAKCRRNHVHLFSSSKSPHTGKGSNSCECFWLGVFKGLYRRKSKTHFTLVYCRGQIALE